MVICMIVGMAAARRQCDGDGNRANGAAGSLLWLCLACLPLVAVANPDAKRLYDDLLSTYNRLIRPVSNNTETVTVKMGLRLSQLLDLVSYNDKQIVSSLYFPRLQYISSSAADPVP
jgi:hypothetical protein